MCCKDKGGESCKLDMGRGCRFCNCETDSTAAVCEGCFKLHTTNWLKDYPDNLPDDILEIRFKNTRRGYYRNVNNLPLKEGDIVAVEANPGHDIGIVSLTGDLVSRQMKRVGFTPLNGEFRKIYRKAKPYDIEKWQEAIAMEHDTMIRSRQIAAELGLNMKIGDVEYQGDKIKAIFYYIADERVDFRELIKIFAEQFRIRVEMKQIGARQEAGRIGGLGSCGRELCCASWISSFVSVTTNSARTQEISLNPQKLAGQCSKLKCCLVYELDSYIDARKEFPRVPQSLHTLDGEYFPVKNDILAGTISYSTSPNMMAGLVTLPVDRVREIIDLNRKGVKVERLEDHAVKNVKEEDPGFVNVIGEESITRFDKVRGSGERKSRGNNSRKGKGGDRNRKPEAPANGNNRQNNKINGGQKARPATDENRAKAPEVQGQDRGQGQGQGQNNRRNNRNRRRRDGNQNGKTENKDQ